MRNSLRVCIVALTGILTAGLSAQTVTPVTPSTNNQGNVPLYRVVVVDHTVPTVNYVVRGGKTSIDMVGTPLLPLAKGHADVEILPGATHIHLEFDKVNPAQRFGPEYLTYVLWAVTPDGRPTNLGEVMLSVQHAAMDVTTTDQAFGLMVTAEPYFAVTRPSDIVVMQNELKPGTKGDVQFINAKAELLRRDQYRLNRPQSEITEIPQDSKVPLDLYEAENAVRIAGWAGAGTYAPEQLENARRQMKQAQSAEDAGAGKAPVATAARQAVQTAEDARLLSLHNHQTADEAAAKAAAAEATATAQAAAQAAQQQSADAVAAKQDAENQKEAADLAAASAREQAAQAQADAAAASAQAEAARDQAQQLAQQEAGARARLMAQLNTVLQTRDSAKGLIVNMSDVLFDFDKYTLTPGAEVKLAKIAGILLSYPDLQIQINGYTDSVGADDYNQQLSLNRANAVRAFLIDQSVQPNALSADGHGKDDPVASNDNAAGRQQNRRVEMVVSGAAIGGGQ